MADPFKHVSPGDSLSIPADTWNHVLDSARAFRSAPGRTGGRQVPSSLFPALTVLMRNDTGSDRGVGSVLKLGESLVEVDSNNAGIVNARPAFEGLEPDSTDNAIGISLDAIPEDAVGRCVVAGVVVVDVNVQDDGHEFAVPVVGNADHLDTAASGSIRILWREAGSSGIRKAIVQMGPGNSAGGLLVDSGPISSVSPDVEVDTTANGTVIVTVLEFDGSPWTPAVGSSAVVWSLDGGSTWTAAPFGAASLTEPGWVSTGTQEFTGEKSFNISNSAVTVPLSAAVGGLGSGSYGPVLEVHAWTTADPSFDDTGSQAVRGGVKLSDCSVIAFGGANTGTTSKVRIRQGYNSSGAVSEDVLVIDRWNGSAWSGIASFGSEGGSSNFTSFVDPVIATSLTSNSFCRSGYFQTTTSTTGTASNGEVYAFKYCVEHPSFSGKLDGISIFPNFNSIFGFQNGIIVPGGAAGNVLTHGDVLIGRQNGATSICAVNIGTLGQVLTVGAAALPEWATPTAPSIAPSAPTTITGIFCGNGSAINGRTLTAPAAGFTISNPNGAAGNPTFALADDLNGVEDIGTTGIAVRASTNVWTTRSITSSGGSVGITNPAGLAGDINLEALRDHLSPLVNSVVSVSAANTTLTSTAFGCMHSLAVSNGNQYYIAFPSSTGNAGKLIGFYINADFAANPVRWTFRLSAATPDIYDLRAGESVVFLCTGSTWLPLYSDRRYSRFDVGDMREIAALGVGSAPPVDTLLCDGSAHSRTTYSVLFNRIGTTYGAGDGSTTFNVPDRRGRVAVGLDNMGGSSANRISASWADSNGGTGGTESHTLTSSESVPHTHSTGQTLNAAAGPIQWMGGPFSIQTATGSWGGSGGVAQPHNNVQPSIACNVVIKF